MNLVYRVWEPETGNVIRALRAKGFEAALLDVSLGFDLGAVEVRGVADWEEAEVADTLVLVVDQTANRLSQR